MPQEWVDTLPDGSISFRLVDPRESALDEFDCGPSPEAVEVTVYFKSRAWFAKGKASPPVFAFGQGEVVIGYAAIAFANRNPPTESTLGRARYLVVYAVGVDQRFQGKVNPGSAPERYAESIFRAIEEFFSTQKPNCVGLYLKVRSSNTRAIRFYERIGFASEQVGAGDGGVGAGHLVMRKRFP